jgi:hypothetical protein
VIQVDRPGSRRGDQNGPLVAVSGEASADESAEMVQGVTQHPALTSEDASGSDLVGFAGKEVALDLDVLSSEGIVGERGGEVEQ